MSSNKKNNDKKTPPRPEKPSPKKSWEILETPKCAARNCKHFDSCNVPCRRRTALVLCRRSMNGAGVGCRWLLFSVCQVGYSLLVKMSQIPIFESLLEKNKTWENFPWSAMTSQMVCLCDSRYCAAVLRTFGPRLQVQRNPNQKGSPFFLGFFFGALPKRSHFFCFLQKWLFCASNSLCDDIFPQVSFHQAVEAGGGLKLLNFCWQKPTRPFPRGENDLCPFSSLAPWKKMVRFGFWLHVDAMICWCKDKRVSFLKSTSCANWEWNLLEKCHFFWSLDEIWWDGMLMRATYSACYSNSGQTSTNHKM